MSIFSRNRPGQVNRADCEERTDSQCLPLYICCKSLFVKAKVLCQWLSPSGRKVLLKHCIEDVILRDILSSFENPVTRQHFLIETLQKITIIPEPNFLKFESFCSPTTFPRRIRTPYPWRLYNLCHQVLVYVIPDAIDIDQWLIHDITNNRASRSHKFDHFSKQIENKDIFKQYF